MSGEKPDGPAARRGAASDAAGGLTVAELLARFRRWAEGYYRGPDGAMTGEVEQLRMALKLWRERYGLTPVADFGPVRLRELRDAMVDQGWSRGTVNRRVRAVRRVVKWGVGEELVDPTVLTRLDALTPLRRGRCGARETDPVKPAPDADVDATIPHLPGPVAAAVRVQRLTGMRPGEVLTMRPCDLARDGGDGGVWTYRPAAHKTQWRGKDRAVGVGPRAQAILAPFLTGRPADKPLFSPREAEAERRAAATAARVTPASCGNAVGTNRKARPARSPGEAYTVASYRRAIHRACDAAGVERWSPNRLRHSHATEVRARLGLDAARAALGHAGASITEVYAEADADLARQVAAEIG